MPHRQDLPATLTLYVLVHFAISDLQLLSFMRAGMPTRVSVDRSVA
jgi:hypothetical protein